MVARRRRWSRLIRGRDPNPDLRSGTVTLRQKTGFRGRQMRQPHFPARGSWFTGAKANYHNRKTNAAGQMAGGAQRRSSGVTGGRLGWCDSAKCPSGGGEGGRKAVPRKQRGCQERGKAGAPLFIAATVARRLQGRRGGGSHFADTQVW